MRNAYDLREEKGIEKGRQEERIEMAKNMLAKDEPIEKIARYTGLPETQIQVIKSNYS